jgi:hypothetical protein
MSGNIKWETNMKRGSYITRDMRDATDIEDACRSVNYINKRKRYEKHREREQKKRTSITLPSLETLKKVRA